MSRRLEEFFLPPQLFETACPRIIQASRTPKGVTLNRLSRSSELPRGLRQIPEADLSLDHPSNSNRGGSCRLSRYSVMPIWPRTLNRKKRVEKKRFWKMTSLLTDDERAQPFLLAKFRRRNRKPRISKLLDTPRQPLPRVRVSV